METEVISPSVSAPYLDAFKLKTVRIVGRITSLQGEMATLDAGGNVNIHLNRVRTYNCRPLPDLLLIVGLFI